MLQVAGESHFDRQRPMVPRGGGAGGLVSIRGLATIRAEGAESRVRIDLE